jgi:hypothetical protein
MHPEGRRQHGGPVIKRHPVRINFELPELTPAQAKLLCEFLDRLSCDLWEAYEKELFDLEAEAFHAVQAADDCNASDEEPPSWLTIPPFKLITDDEPDF